MAAEPKSLKSSIPECYIFFGFHSKFFVLSRINFIKNIFWLSADTCIQTMLGWYVVVMVHMSQPIVFTHVYAIDWDIWSQIRQWQWNECVACVHVCLIAYDKWFRFQKSVSCLIMWKMRLCFWSFWHPPSCATVSAVASVILNYGFGAEAHRPWNESLSTPLNPLHSLWWRKPLINGPSGNFPIACAPLLLT